MNLYRPLPFDKFDRVVDTSHLRSALGERIGEINSLISSFSAHKSLETSDYQRIYFYHVRKTAGTAIAYAFYRLGGDPYSIEEQLKYFTFASRSGYRFVGVNRHLIESGRYYFATSHMPKYELDLPRDGTFDFTVLRDPVERVLSLYRYLANPLADSSYATGALDHEYVWAADGFQTFLDRVPRQHLLNQLYMFSRTGDIDEAAEALDSISFVIRTESLSQDILTLQHHLGLHLELRFERESKHAPELSDQEMERLQEMAAPEYEMIDRLRADSGVD
jgi:hypothetical protein